MKFEGEPGLAESLGQALGSLLSEGSSSLEALQGSFPSVISPQSAKAGGLCAGVSLPHSPFLCQIPPCNKLRLRLSLGSVEDT